MPGKFYIASPQTGLVNPFVMFRQLLAWRLRREYTKGSTLPCLHPNPPDSPSSKGQSEKLMDVTLQVQLGPWLGKKTRVPIGHRAVVGRGPRSDITLSNDASVSREHFALDWDNVACWLSDLNSGHGTFLNGKKVQRARLHDGDRIRVGWTVLVVRLEAPDSSDAMAGYGKGMVAADSKALAEFEAVTADAVRPDPTVQSVGPGNRSSE